MMVMAGGDWTVRNARELDAELLRVGAAPAPQVTFDVAEVGLLDTAGAWLLHRTMESVRGNGGNVDLRGAAAEHATMLEQVAASFRPCEMAPPQGNAVVRLVEQVGESTLAVCDTAADFVAFFGRAVLVLFRTLLRPARLRLTSTVYHMQEVGLNAVPIVALISFLIGVVLAYQGAIQLQRFGAQIFVVDLLAFSVLREVGILLTAIVIAGRSGSAFTAQLGSMKVNEEVDALLTLGLDPMEVLVLPRAIALVLTLPLLAFFSDMMGLLGGGLMCWLTLDIGPGLFLERLNSAVSMWTFWVGIIKAPVFAALIALVGCYEGMQVSGSAESVGRHTTRAVVESIFLVIVADAFFSVFFGVIGV